MLSSNTSANSTLSGASGSYHSAGVSGSSGVVYGSPSGSRTSEVSVSQPQMSAPLVSGEPTVRRYWRSRAWLTTSTPPTVT
ncbi:hypothetical protein [Streptomyces olivaceoviridis]|uniref:hypothetical protein n=1 Tax=Streptomyces olivaceoviridis TaxID=1921 RepID=UPI003319C907